LLSSIASFSVPAIANEDSAQNKVAPPIKVVTEYLVPYQVKNADGSLGGFSTEVVRALFSQLNEKANIHVMPWARAYEVAKQEKNTLIFSIAHTPIRSELFHWVGSLTKERLYFWGLKTKFPQPIDDVDQLKDYKIAASRYSNVAQYLIDHSFYNIYQLIKEEQNMLMLYRSRVDLIIATELNLKNRAEKLGLNFNEMQQMAEVPELNNDLCIAFSLNTPPSVVTRFKQAFNEIKQQGVIEEIKQKWHIE